MSRVSQSKAQTEANAKLLRQLVKQPDNKTCADCKRNDPRWASWNLGCYLCIRCSGIHRSMGTHISKVKSIDLDIWTPEQMETIQAWGNRRANAYWEAHLKANHSPPEHKVEAFIRSKYESRRWAKEGPVPTDPSVLDDGAPASSAAPAAPPAKSAPAAAGATKKPSAARATAVDLLGGEPSAAAATTATSSKGAFDAFLDDAPPPQTKPAAVAAAPAPAAAAASGGGGSGSGGGGLFDLDWNSPAPATSATSPGLGSQRGKADILSLYSSAKLSSPQQQQQHQFGGLTSSFGGLDLGSAPAPAQAAPAAGGGNPWAASGGSENIWGDMTGGSAAAAAPAKPAAAGASKDAFADIWGDFK